MLNMPKIYCIADEYCKKIGCSSQSERNYIAMDFEEFLKRFNSIKNIYG
jgi:hypothetical protein